MSLFDNFNPNFEINEYINTFEYNASIKTNGFNYPAKCETKIPYLQFTIPLNLENKSNFVKLVYSNKKLFNI